MIFISATGLWITEAIPPFTITFSIGTVNTKEIAKTGTLVSFFGIVVLMLLAILLLNAENVN
jgi:di/tricarboxylate transporter